MTYTFKLSRRLAVLRASVVLPTVALCLSCSAGEPTAVSEAGLLPDLPVTVAPRRVTLEPTQQALFLAYNRGGTAADSQVTSIEWTATGGSISSSGLFSSTDVTGEYRVVGKRRGVKGKPPVSDTAVIIIVPPQPDLVGITLTPATVSLPSGTQQTFKATGRLSDGSSVDIGVNWSATGGSIDAGGTYTAGSTPGSYQVTAQAASANVSATVPVAITAPATLQSISLTPSSVSLGAGARQLFTVSGRMSDGSQVSITNATFSASGGTIDGTGSFTAGNASGSYQVTAQLATAAGGTFRATAAVTITGGSSGSYPNQPAGFARVTELSASGIWADHSLNCSGNGVLAGCWQRWTSMLALTSDASAPQSPSSVLEYTWPAGLPIGNSAGMINAWDGSTNGELSRTEYSQVYESGWIKLAGSTFEAPDAGMKLLGFWGVGEGRDWNKVANQVFTMTPGGTMSSFPLHWLQQGPVTRRMVPNVNGSPLVVVGQWTRYEVYMKLNDIGSANGILKVWINGTLTHDYRDVTWRTSTSPSGFFGRRWDPIWGGMGNPATKTKTDRMLIDHVYISGVR